MENIKEPLTREQLSKIETLTKYVSDNFDVSQEPDYYLSSWLMDRYLTARKYKIKKAKKMILGYFTFKKRMDKVLAENPDFYGSPLQLPVYISSWER